MVTVVPLIRLTFHYKPILLPNISRIRVCGINGALHRIYVYCFLVYQSGYFPRLHDASLFHYQKLQYKYPAPASIPDNNPWIFIPYPCLLHHNRLHFSRIGCNISFTITKRIYLLSEMSYSVSKTLFVAVFLYVHVVSANAAARL